MDSLIKTKRLFITGTVALAITVTGVLLDKELKANVSRFQLENADTQNVQTVSGDDFLHVLGVSSDTEVYDSMLQGKTLADIASEHDKDVNNIIHLQIAELTTQMDARLANGTLSPAAYRAQKAELEDIVKRSVYGEKEYILK